MNETYLSLVDQMNLGKMLRKRHSHCLAIKCSNILSQAEELQCYPGQFRCIRFTAMFLLHMSVSLNAPEYTTTWTVKFTLAISISAPRMSAG